MTDGNEKKGRLYGLGVGPGDPELITLKAARILSSVPVVAWPAPLEGPSLARTIAEPHLPEGIEEIAIRMPMETARFPAQNVYDEAAVRIGLRLQAGCDVAVLCEGDPFFYGSFMYLFGRLADRFEVEVVPGVSSLTASAAAMGFPLASRNDVLTVLPAPLEEEELSARLAATDAAAIIKVGRHFEKVRRVIEGAGLTDNAHIVTHATFDDQTVRCLADVPEGEQVPYFSLILIHRRGEAWR